MIRPAAPFTSHVSGQEFAVLLPAGWVPAALVFGISLGSRHDDTRTRTQTRRRQATARCEATPNWSKIPAGTRGTS